VFLVQPVPQQGRQQALQASWLHVKALTPRLARRCSARRLDASSAVNTVGLPVLMTLLPPVAAKDATMSPAAEGCRFSTLPRLEPVLDREMRRSSDLRICLNCTSPRNTRVRDQL